MKFRHVKSEHAAGMILAHSHMLPGGLISKGTQLSAADCAALVAQDVEFIHAAELDPGDISENAAAAALAQDIISHSSSLRCGTAATGRCNMYARAGGLAEINADVIHQINAIDPAVTVATVANWTRVEAGQMVATAKIIPFAVPADILAQAQAQIMTSCVTLHTFQPKKIACILTRLPGTTEKLIDKSVRTTRARCTALGARMGTPLIVAHDVAALADALARASADIILVMGAAALVDAADTVPASIVASGGTLERVGMPVDPGNLLCLGRTASGTPAIGLPGCARSPKRNGFDWVLERLCADLPVTSQDIARMGVGGLLAEMRTRPSPRTRADLPPAPKSAPIRAGAILLAAGSARRMGGVNKQLAELGGKPLLRHALDAVASAGLAMVLVTGRDASAVQALGVPCAASTVHNPDFATGIASSLRAGLLAAPDAWDAAFIVLGDMPDVPASIFTTLSTALAANPDAVCAYPVMDGQQGHPVLWQRCMWDQLMALEGDSGGKAVLASLGRRALAVPVAHAGVLTDVDTPEAFSARAAL